MAMDTCRRCERRTHVNTSRICADCAEGGRRRSRRVLPAWAAEFDTVAIPSTATWCV